MARFVEKIVPGCVGKGVSMPYGAKGYHKNFADVMFNEREFADRAIVEQGNFALQLQRC